MVYVLPGGDIDREFLFGQLLDRTAQSTRVHLFVDACNAAGLVGEKGPSIRLNRVATSQDSKDAPLRPLRAYPHVGAVLASSALERAHEWVQIAAGVFTYQVTSGLLGPADADLDRKISYGEVAAFVGAANGRVKNRNVRPRFIVIPPVRTPTVALVEWPEATTVLATGDLDGDGILEVAVPWLRRADSPIDATFCGAAVCLVVLTVDLRDAAREVDARSPSPHDDGARSVSPVRIRAALRGAARGCGAPPRHDAGADEACDNRVGDARVALRSGSRDRCPGSPDGPRSGRERPQAAHDPRAHRGLARGPPGP